MKKFDVKRISKKGKVTIIVLLIVLIGVGVVSYFMTRCPIVFKEENIKIEINGKFDALKNILEVRGGKIEDVKIDTHKINYHKLGEYPLVYTYNEKNYELTLKVVDTKKPKFDIVDLNGEVGMKIKAKDLVKNVQDETKTTIKFKEDYQFNKAGKHKVTVVVSDAAGNQTEKNAVVKLVKDDEAPKLTIANDITVRKDAKVDYRLGVSLSDNQDPNPKLTIDDSQVKLNKLGKYDVIYVASDRAGNKVERKRVVEVVENKEIGTYEQTDEKIVYLTFDDGPSENTAKILDILDRYNAKATFFVTGNNQKYNYLIKDAHDRGHTIALHTYCHDYAKVYASVDAYFNDLNQISQMVKEITGVESKYVRFPGGASNTVSRKYTPGIMSILTKELINRGYQYYDWNGDSTDAMSNKRPVSALIANATSSKANNINILCHDTSAKTTTVEALPAIIENYLARGYRFEAISDNSFVPHQKVNN